jgi:Holliday junction DNA helicase RuvA
MIAHLKGRVIHKDEKYLVLEASSVGYKVYGTFETIESSPLESDKSLWIYHTVREDASDLFGFTSKDELDFFELLISISGIGPRTALGILNVTTVSALKRAVSSGDTSHLIKVSGIGKKNAEKIVLELKDKFKKGEEDGAGYKEEVDALDALKSLGFSHNDAREALKQVADAPNTSERVKRALKILGK